MARIQHYDQGDVWTPQATFTVGGVATDPTTITARVKDPDGTVTVFGPHPGDTGGSGLTRVADGTYAVAVPLTDAGYWFVRFEGEGAAHGAQEHQAIVDPSEFYEDAQLGSRALVTLAEAKDWLEQQNVDTTGDLELARVINDISSRFHDEAEREFMVSGTNPQTRTFEVEPLGRPVPRYVDGDYMGDLNTLRRRVKVGDLATLTSVEILDTDWATILVTPTLGQVTVRPFTRQDWEPIRELELHPDVVPLQAGMRVQVTGDWGFPKVPGNVRQAVLDAVAAVMDRDVEHYRQDQAPVGQGGGLASGTVVVLSGGRQKMLSMPPTSLAVAWSYRNENVTVG